jgi:tetratricopeptide (TPR) repeat protein
MSSPSVSPARRSRARVRPIGILVAAVVVAGASTGLAWLAHRPSTAAPASSADQASRRDDRIAAPGALADPATPDDLAAIDDELRLWVPKADADVHDDLSAGTVAMLYLGRGRLTGDAADYERALAAADRAVVANPATGTQALKATVLQATHDFTGALGLAEALLKTEPDNVDALAVAGDARLELGRLDEAAATYARIQKLLPGPALDAREARLSWLRGNAGQAIQLATQARDEAAESTTSDPSFYEAQLGEMARLVGKADVARAGYEAALAMRPSNQLAMLGIARLDAFAGDDASAITELRKAAAIAPRPETLGLLADLEARTGDAHAAAADAATIHAIEQLGGAAAQLFDRQIAGFDLDHGDATRAVTDRLIAAAKIRPDAAGLDLEAWALFRLDDVSIARTLSDRALATGSVDARVLYHAGAIRIADGDRAGGLDLVRRAIALGAALDPVDRAGAVAVLAG